MNLVTFEPPDAPSLDQQLDALSKGLGRAVSWAKSGRLDEESLLATCLRDCQYDAQLEEGNRGDWLWGMVEAVGAVDRFREPILAALTNLSETWTANQLCVLARHYAEAGDEAFRQRLRAIVRDEPVEECPWLGEDELIQVEGEAGFRFVVQVRGERLASPERGWEDFLIVGTATELFGATRTTQLLNEATDEASSRFREAWERHEAVGKQPPPQRPSLADRTVAGVIQAAETQPEAYWLGGWGRQAAPDKLREVARRLWRTSEPRVLANLLRVFSGRALPEFDPRLIDLCRHDDPDTRRAAFIALGRNTHPLVRAFALNEIASGPDQGLAVGLLVHNAQPGDEALILGALQLPDDQDERHWLLMTVRDFLKANPTADASALGALIYALTPCGICRRDALKILLNRGVAPAWMKDEARWDANEQCRTLVTEDRDSSPAS